MSIRCGLGHGSKVAIPHGLYIGALHNRVLHLPSSVNSYVFASLFLQNPGGLGLVLDFLRALNVMWCTRVTVKSVNNFGPGQNV
ncbi:GL21225 [Drosophila persimilis]|uniref:GL21225 n=1 Tax=Drosophila persimilis TaxID=7234 RepID=B4HAS4_DROPE|nr:GL21225 [Drosophila persimilis]